MRILFIVCIAILGIQTSFASANTFQPQHIAPLTPQHSPPPHERDPRIGVIWAGFICSLVGFIFGLQLLITGVGVPLLGLSVIGMILCSWMLARSKKQMVYKPFQKLAYIGELLGFIAYTIALFKRRRE